MFILMPIIFVLGILLIALEDKIRINKAAIALLTAVILWTILIVDASALLGGGQSPAFENFLQRVPGFAELPLAEQYLMFIGDISMNMNLGDISQTLFFVMSTMIVIELVDKNGGFALITSTIKTKNKRRFLWIVSIMTFIMSALLDNLATAIVMIALLRKFIPHQRERWIFSSMIIIAANAGGCWSPIGDVTTILLWVNGNITALSQIGHLFIPAVVCMMVPLVIVSLFFKKSSTWPDVTIENPDIEQVPLLEKRKRVILLVLGVLSLLMAPIFRQLTGLPPFMGVLLGMTVIWIYSEIMYNRMSDVAESSKIRLVTVFANIDFATIFFFLGILMSVSALNTAGQLGAFSTFLDSAIGNPPIIAFIIGVISSFLDNVALVAATIGMYPIADAAAGITPYVMNFVPDGTFWTFLAYCAVTGGSILIIGSATGVTVMGMEKIPFMYYTKRFTLVALSGYVSGALTYYLLFM